MQVTTCTIQGCCDTAGGVAKHTITTTTATMVMTRVSAAGEEKEDQATILAASEASSNALIVLSNPRLPQEVGHAVLRLPTALQVLGADVMAHMRGQPRRPSWNLQTTVILGFMQAFRDQTLHYSSLDFWRFILLGTTLLTPLTCRIQDTSFVVKSRPLDCVGLLRACDQAETGNRVLTAEWMAAVSVWDQCVQTVWPSAPPNALLNTKRKRSTERIILYVHGGAYCSMSAQTHRILTHKISKATGRRMFVINYRLAPETTFPGALYDVIQAYLYLTDPDEPYNFDPKCIMVMGDSAGGGLALAMLLYLRDHGLPAPEAACLLSPWVDLTFQHASWNDSSTHDYLPNDPSLLDNLNPQPMYLGPEYTQDMLRHPYVSPLYADNFEHLPPIMIQSGGCEPLRDEIKHLYQRINESNTTFAHHEVYEDMVHVFQAFPFGSKPDDAIKSIGWWAKTGAAMISTYQGKQSKLTPNGKDLVLGSFITRGIAPPLLGRRHRSIPG
ncbi:alpha/beta hydrolase fold-domain-containing protein [Gongronella butleri]|nr:alpha/beta hydrolase fold-domain-containing protein [Gongronella butleri]